MGISDEQYESVKRGVGLVTAWRSDPEAVGDLSTGYLRQIVEEDGGPGRLLVGLMNVAGALLLQCEANGQDPYELLQHIEEHLRPDDG